MTIVQQKLNKIKNGYMSAAKMFDTKRKKKHRHKTPFFGHF